MFRLEHISSSAIVCTKCSNWNILELCSNWSILSIRGCAYPEIRMSWVKWNGVWGLGAAEVAWGEWRRRLALGGGECQLHRLANSGECPVGVPGLPPSFSCHVWGGVEAPGAVRFPPAKKFTAAVKSAPMPATYPKPIRNRSACA
jgi:hypothetical protein